MASTEPVEEPANTGANAEFTPEVAGVVESVDEEPSGGPEVGVAVLAEAGRSEPIVLSVGDIGITQHWVTTPNGYAPLRGSQWIVTDRSVTERSIPTWAIVCAIIFALACLLGLLFLLVKETKTSGYVQVSVRSGDLYHATEIPVSSPQGVAWARQLVSQAQSLAASAPPAPAA